MVVVPVRQGDSMNRYLVTVMAVFPVLTCICCDAQHERLKGVQGIGYTETS